MPGLRQEYPSLPRHSLVVCAALVENPINLGMLCRTAEAFRLESLVVPDPDLANPAGAGPRQRAFRQGAANAHRWQPLIACPPEALLPWLAQQRDRGYQSLALHLSPQAVPLPQVQFPQRAVLVLGRELTGVPPAVVAACDRQVVIPQYGLVQSLNVQTAAAMAVYAYICQWGMPPAPLK